MGISQTACCENPRNARRRLCQEPCTEHSDYRNNVALNSGHYEALKTTLQRVIWWWAGSVAVGDKLTRTTHLNANGQKVAKGAPFIVGGYECEVSGRRYFAAARDRVRCRCTFVGVIAE